MMQRRWIVRSIQPAVPAWRIRKLLPGTEETVAARWRKEVRGRVYSGPPDGTRRVTARQGGDVCVELRGRLVNAPRGTLLEATLFFPMNGILFFIGCPLVAVLGAGVGSWGGALFAAASALAGGGYYAGLAVQLSRRIDRVYEVGAASSRPRETS